MTLIRGKYRKIVPSLFPSVRTHDPVVTRELPVIKKIIADETWLEGERRGCSVPCSDPVVVNNVCSVIMRVGKQLRQSLSDCAAEDKGLA